MATETDRANSAVVAGEKLEPGQTPETTSDAPVGERIRVARLARGLTQGDLAAMVGVSRSAVAQWETDRSGQVRRNLARVAATLGLNVADLLGEPSLVAAGTGRDSPEMPPGAPRSADEIALMRLYRECAEPDRALLLRTALRLARAAIAASPLDAAPSETVPHEEN